MKEEGVRRLPGRKLPRRFFEQPTIRVAKELLGSILCRREENGLWTCGMVVETEAYIGRDDPACHASAGLTPRTRVMFGPPGRAYFYFTYGMHTLFNVVTEAEGFPAAVLIRALEPRTGLTRMMGRRPSGTARQLLAAGPARLCQAMGLSLEWNTLPVTQAPLVFVERKHVPSIRSGPRIGISKGVERPWRFWVSGSRFVTP